MDPDGNGDPESFFQKLNNLYNLQAEVDQIVAGAAQAGSRFFMTEETVKTLHRIATFKLLEDAGEYRKIQVKLTNSPHIPPNWIEVPAHMSAFCSYVNEMWQTKDLVHLSAFCLWRLNWIHPFRNGNGRTARAISYLVMCAKHGKILPAKNTVAQQIVETKLEHDNMLRLADTIYASTGNVEQSLMELERFLARLLVKQLQASF